MKTRTKDALPAAVPLTVAAPLLGIGLNRLRQLIDEGVVPCVDPAFTGRRRKVPRWFVLDDGHEITK